MLTKYEIEEEKEVKKVEIKNPAPTFQYVPPAVDFHADRVELPGMEITPEGITITTTQIPNPTWIDYSGVHVEPLQYHVEPITWDATMAQDEVQVTHASGTMNLVEEPFIAHEIGGEIVVPLENMNLLRDAIFPDPDPPQYITMDDATEYIPF